MCRSEVEEDFGNSSVQNFSNPSEFIEEYLEEDSDVTSDTEGDIQ